MRKDKTEMAIEVFCKNNDTFFMEKIREIDGVEDATMIQYKTGFSISYMSLLINIPLSILAYFLVQKDFAVKTLLFSVFYSVSFLLQRRMALQMLQVLPSGV